MSKKVIRLALGVMLLALTFPAEAQRPPKAARIGVLSIGTLRASPDSDAFRQGLRELGYIEGQNIAIEWRSAESKLDKLPALAADLVQLKVDIIVAMGGPSVHAAKKATGTIPIVMTNAGDPVDQGFVASLARPGGNVTGLSSLTLDLPGKRLELLKETIPKLSRLAVLWYPDATGTALSWKESQLAARENWICGFNRWRCAVRRILTAHSEPQLRSARRLCSL